MPSGGPSRGFFDAWSRVYDFPLVQRATYRPVHDAVLRALGTEPCTRVLDVGCGTGRLAARLGELSSVRSIVGLDFSAGMLEQARARLASADATALVRGDATRLPFADGTFDIVITSEVLEHIQDDVAAISEMTRVLKPGGRFAATVPAWSPEIVNWKLSDEYHAPKAVGGHVRIYTRTELRAKLRTAGLEVDGYHRAHALHSPYWWLKCAVGPRNDEHPLVVKYRKFLEWDIIEQPASTKVAERVLSPVLGKSAVHYATKRPTTKRCES
jgi:SAM-dependent methyltransferase